MTRTPSKPRTPNWFQTWEQSGSDVVPEDYERSGTGGNSPHGVGRLTIVGRGGYLFYVVNGVCSGERVRSTLVSCTNVFGEIS